MYRYIVQAIIVSNIKSTFINSKSISSCVLTTSIVFQFCCAIVKILMFSTLDEIYLVFASNKQSLYIIVSENCIEMYIAVLTDRCRLREMSNDIYSTFILSCLSLHKTKFT